MQRMCFPNYAYANYPYGSLNIWLFAVIDDTQTMLTMPEISRCCQTGSTWRSCPSTSPRGPPQAVADKYASLVWSCNKGNLRAVQRHFTELSWAVCWQTTHSRRVSFQVGSIRNNMKQGCWIMLTLPTAGFGPCLGSLHHQRPEFAWI